MRPRVLNGPPDRYGDLEPMRDQLAHALVEALFELDVLPSNRDGALVGLYAVMDDLRLALSRAERLDPGIAPR